MHIRASNSELVEPLPEPERTRNQRLRRQNRRVPFEQRNNPPQHPKIVYPPILDINYFRYFLITLQNLSSMDDEPMWATDRVVALTLGNEFAIKGHFIPMVRIVTNIEDFEGLMSLSLDRETYRYLDSGEDDEEKAKDGKLVLLLIIKCDMLGNKFGARRVIHR
ncbi:hypothetical protein Tco_0280399 [Tanacetum coccineum]